jgi:predicted acetyltransferase
VYELELQLPALGHKKAAEDFKKEFFDNHETVINGSALLDQLNYEEWLEYNIKNRNKSTASPNWVPATTFFAFRKQDNKIVGIIDIRHNLENEFLAEYGGHIGFSVRPTERKKGYATEMLNIALKYAKSLGLKKVMLGCFSDNIASIKTIEKCGGVLTETKVYSGDKLNMPDLQAKTVNIYWIEL